MVGPFGIGRFTVRKALSLLNTIKMQSYRFSLVKIPVWVTNRQGIARINLEKSDFKVTVDRREVKIEDCILAFNRPMELIYLVDVSGSMAIGGKLQGSIEAVTYLMDQRRPEDRFKVIAFADGSIIEVVNQDDLASWDTLKHHFTGLWKDRHVRHPGRFQPLL